MIVIRNREDPPQLTGPDLDHYLAMGWYRMHQCVFTISHLISEPNLSVHRVHWLRYPVACYRDRTEARRIRKRNSHLRHVISDVETVPLMHRLLYAKYRLSIDFDGYPSIEEALFGGPEGPSIFLTKCLAIYDGERLIAGGYFDVGATSAASILHFYDPDYSRHSLGKYLMLLTLDYLRAEGYDWYYPGYLVAGKTKMNYKLFVGREHFQYWDPDLETWQPYHDAILEREEYADGVEREIVKLLLG